MSMKHGDALYRSVLFSIYYEKSIQAKGNNILGLINGCKCSDDYEECRKMLMLFIGVFFFQYIMKKSIQAKGNNILGLTVVLYRPPVTGATDSVR